MSGRVSSRFAFAGLVVSVLALTAAADSRAQTRTPQGYLDTLTNPRSTVDENGHIVVTLEAAGELRGLITIELDADAAGGFTGKWAMAVAYTQNLNPDGTVDNTPPQPEEPGPVDPEHHHEYIRFVNEGTVNGTVQTASLKYAADGTIVGLASAQLLVDSGSVNFAGATGAGEIVPSALDPNATTLSLSF